MQSALVAAEHDARRAAARRLPGMEAMLKSHVALPVPREAPARPLGFCVAALAAADSACIIALGLTTRGGVRPDVVEATLEAGRALVAASRNGAHALDAASDEVDCALLTHTTALAAHDAADALELLAGGTERPRATPIAAYPVPSSWRALNARLHVAILDGKHGEAGTRHGVAATARDAALRAFSICAEVHNHDGLSAAMHRVTRVTALACVYAGWASLTLSGRAT
jgi:hypothetical protein